MITVAGADQCDPQSQTPTFIDFLSPKPNADPPPATTLIFVDRATASPGRLHPARSNKITTRRCRDRKQPQEYPGLVEVDCLARLAGVKQIRARLISRSRTDQVANID